MKKLLSAFPLALFSMQTLAAEAGKSAKAAPNSSETIMVLLGLFGIVLGLVLFFVYLAKTNPKDKKDPEKKDPE